MCFNQGTEPMPSRTYDKFAIIVPILACFFFLKPKSSLSPVNHYDDVTIGPMAFQITSLTIVYSTVYSDADQRNHQNSPSLAFVRGCGEFTSSWSLQMFTGATFNGIYAKRKDLIWIWYEYWPARFRHIYISTNWPVIYVYIEMLQTHSSLEQMANILQTI